MGGFVNFFSQKHYLGGGEDRRLLLAFDSTISTFYAFFLFFSYSSTPTLLRT